MSIVTCELIHGLWTLASVGEEHHVRVTAARARAGDAGLGGLCHRVPGLGAQPLLLDEESPDETVGAEFRTRGRACLSSYEQAAASGVRDPVLHPSFAARWVALVMLPALGASATCSQRHHMHHQGPFQLCCHFRPLGMVSRTAPGRRL